MAALQLFPARIQFVNPDGTLTPPAYRALQAIVERTGGVLGNAGGDTFVTSNDFSGVEASQSAGGDVSADVVMGQASEPAMHDTVTQPASISSVSEMVMQPASLDAMHLDIPQFPTVTRPAYQKGRLYFDTTLNKLVIGGATAYETITSL